jgi:hypothetical protein
MGSPELDVAQIDHGTSLRIYTKDPSSHPASGVHLIIQASPAAGMPKFTTIVSQSITLVIPTPIQVPASSELTTAPLGIVERSTLDHSPEHILSPPIFHTIFPTTPYRGSSATAGLQWHTRRPAATTSPTRPQNMYIELACPYAAGCACIIFAPLPDIEGAVHHHLQWHMGRGR